jgi:hypothetical protein
MVNTLAPERHSWLTDQFKKYNFNDPNQMKQATDFAWDLTQTQGHTTDQLADVLSFTGKNWTGQDISNHFTQQGYRPGTYSAGNGGLQEQYMGLTQPEVASGMRATTPGAPTPWAGGAKSYNQLPYLEQSSIANQTHSARANASGLMKSGQGSDVADGVAQAAKMVAAQPSVIPAGTPKPDMQIASTVPQTFNPATQRDDWLKSLDWSEANIGKSVQQVLEAKAQHNWTDEQIGKPFGLTADQVQQYMVQNTGASDKSLYEVLGKSGPNAFVGDDIAKLATYFGITDLGDPNLLLRKMNEGLLSGSDLANWMAMRAGPAGKEKLNVLMAPYTQMDVDTRTTKKQAIGGNDFSQTLEYDQNEFLDPVTKQWKEYTDGGDGTFRSHNRQGMDARSGDPKHTNVYTNYSFTRDPDTGKYRLSGAEGSLEDTGNSGAPFWKAALAIAGFAVGAQSLLPGVTAGGVPVPVGGGPLSLQSLFGQPSGQPMGPPTEANMPPLGPEFNQYLPPAAPTGTSPSSAPVQGPPPNPYLPGNGVANAATNLLPKLAGIPAVLNAINGGGSNSGNTGSGGGIFGGDAGLPDVLRSLFDVGSGVLDAQRQGDAADKYMKWMMEQQAKMDNVYAPGSPEYNQLWEQMSRKDAAAGRNSQYGPRSVDLAAKIAEFKSKNTKDFAMGMAGPYQKALAQDAAKYAGLTKALGSESMNRALSKYFGGGNRGDQLAKTVTEMVQNGSITNKQFYDILEKYPEMAPIDYGDPNHIPTEDDVLKFIDNEFIDYGDYI